MFIVLIEKKTHHRGLRFLRENLSVSQEPSKPSVIWPAGFPVHPLFLSALLPESPGQKHSHLRAFAAAVLLTSRMFCLQVPSPSLVVSLGLSSEDTSSEKPSPATWPELVLPYRHSATDP